MISGTSNRDQQVAEVTNVSSCQSASNIRLHVGLGPVRSIDRLGVYWPSGAQQALQNVAADRIVNIREP